MQRILLLDLDQVSPRRSVRSAWTRKVLRRRWTWVVASARPPLLAQWEPVLTDTAVILLLADFAPEAADHALIHAARSLAAPGRTEIVVASNDGAFAVLAEVARLSVWTPRPHKVSGRLSAVAAEVRFMPFPRRG